MLPKKIKQFFVGTPPDVTQQVEALLSAMPTPVVWLLGKPQSGKSSIVSGLTGLSKIEIGEGFRPCTKASSLYSFPSEEIPLLRFLDTRGLFETSYDPTEDIAAFEQEAHLILLTIRHNDHANQSLKALLETIKQRKPNWTVVAVLTCLHESYPGESTHPLPYPTSESQFKEEIRRHLSFHKQTFGSLVQDFVLIDFTKAEDEITPQYYGKEALLGTLHQNLPKIAWNFLKETAHSTLSDSYRRQAEPHLRAYAALASTAAISPLPWVDIPIIAAVQLKMLHSISSIYRQELSRERFFEIISVLAYQLSGRFLVRGLLKVVPGGSILYAAFASSTTYALGKVLCFYFERVRMGALPTHAELRAHFAEQLDLYSTPAPNSKESSAHG